MLNGGTFFLSNATVRGNVQVSGGRLILTNATVLGNVEISGGGTFSIGSSTFINGQLHIQNLPAGVAQNQICGATVTGDLQFQNNGIAVEIGAASMCVGNTIGGNLQVQNNAASTTIFNNTVTGHLQDQNNTASTLVVGNSVGGNLQIQNNTASVAVALNSVQNNLLCQDDPSISGGSNSAKRNQGCPTTLQAQAFATSDGANIVFKSPAGATVFTIPLLNQEVVSSTPQGNVTNVTHQRAIVSDDGSHAGVYTVTFVVSPNDAEAEAVVTGTFAYYSASGQLWQTTAPVGTAFYLPLDTTQRLITPDGARILIISADDGNTDPALSVYDQSGNALYQSTGAFVGLYQAQISPNGRYLLVEGVVTSASGYQDLIRVIDLNTMVSTDLPVNLATSIGPAISIFSDGRFKVSYQGSQTVLPVE